MLYPSGKMQALARKMKIVILTRSDFGGSAWQIVQAVRQHSHHEIHLVKFNENAIKSPADIVLSDIPEPIIGVNGFPIRPRDIEEVPYIIGKGINGYPIYGKCQRAHTKEVECLIRSADIIHFKDDYLASYDWYGFKIPMNKKVIVTVGGSGFRRSAKYEKAALALHSFDDYKKISHIRTALTPDLNYPEFDATYTQQAINSNKKHSSWRHKKVPVIVHSPTNRAKKGTDKYVLPALELLKERGLNFELDLIEKTSQAECIERKKRATIFIDQCVTGFYGNAALEAMQYGIPTAAWIRSSAFKQSDGKLNSRNCPIINIKPSVDDIADKIGRLLLNEKRLKEISRRTKIFCDNFHDYRPVAAMWTGIYEGVKNAI